MKEPSEFFLRVRQIAALTSVPFILLLGPFIGYLIGQWADQRFGFHPFSKLIFITLGFAAAVRETARIVRREAGNK